jgi:hypothetical protein
MAEMKDFATIDEAIRTRFFSTFAKEACEGAAATHGVSLLPEAECGHAANASIVPIVIGRPPGGWASCAEAAKLQADLRRPSLGHASVIHVGQPVQLGERIVLRVCASAPHVNAVAKRMAEGAGFEAAFAPVRRDLQALFAKTAHLLGGGEA